MQTNKLALLQSMTNEDLLSELVWRMHNHTKTNILMSMWNSFTDRHGHNYAIKITPREA